MSKTTFLYSHHQSLKAKIIEFGGYLMPLEYQGINQEHLIVRQKVGVFDVSHMGKILISGPKTRDFVNYVFTNKLNEQPFIATYGLFLNEEGLIVDDLIAYPLQEDRVLLVVNASNTQKDYEHLLSLAKNYPHAIEVSDQTSNYGQLVLQGPESEKVLAEILKTSFHYLKFFHFQMFDFASSQLLISRSGYTGEDGFEIYGPPDAITILWEKLIANGVAPIGLGARDTLRFEAGLSLYGHEIDATVNPYEANLGFAVNQSKEFIGQKALLKIKNQGLSRYLVGLKILEKAFPRQGYPITSLEGKLIGKITSGYILPSQSLPLALAYLDVPYNTLETQCYVLIRQKPILAEVIKPIFIQKKYFK